jgi:hypothetical protein
MLTYQVISASILYQDRSRDSAYSVLDYVILGSLYSFQVCVVVLYIIIYWSLRKIIKQIELMASMVVSTNQSDEALHVSDSVILVDTR